MKFGIRVCLKHLNDRSEFELDRAKRKINIAKNWFALEYNVETDNSFVLVSTLYIGCFIGVFPCLDFRSIPVH